MFYLKALGTGALSAMGATALYLAIKLGWSIVYLRFVLEPQAKANATSGSWDVSYPQSINLLGPLAIGFVFGCWWAMRR